MMTAMILASILTKAMVMMVPMMMAMMMTDRTPLGYHQAPTIYRARMQHRSYPELQ
jgi:hypothetical protein